jgi:hypothetical protein
MELGNVKLFYRYLLIRNIKKNIQKLYRSVISLREVTVIFIVYSFYIKVLQITVFSSAFKTCLPRIVKYFASLSRQIALRKI